MSRVRAMSDEEKVAVKLANLVSDIRLDLDQVGIYVGRQTPATPFNRLKEIIESAEQEVTNEYIRKRNDRLF
jgi:hypothetical protein